MKSSTISAEPSDDFGKAPPPGQRPHVVFLNRSFWPDTEATGQLLTELATDLASWFDVTVIAGLPNHVEADEQLHATVCGTAEYRGVSIHRVWHSRFSKHSRLGRLVNLVTFTLSAWQAGRRLCRRPDVLVAETDPFFLPLVGRRLQLKFGGCPLVCYLQDLYPDIAVVVGKVREGWITRTIRRMLFDVYRRAKRVIVLSRDMRQRCESYGVPAAALQVISNWADTDVVQPIKSENAFRREHGLEGKFVVMYSGNMGLVHDLDTVVDAAALLRDRSDIEWVFIGDGAQRPALARRVEQLGLTRVRFLPYQPRSFLGHSLSAADVHLVSLRPEAAACVMPSKLYGILASGTPVIVVTEPETELFDLVNDYEIGFTCLPHDEAALAERIQELADDSELSQQMSMNSRKLAVSEFSRRRQTPRMAELLCRAMQQELPPSLVERLRSVGDKEIGDPWDISATDEREPDAETLASQS